MKNNNAAIVRKITGRALTSDKKRNFFLVMAITLTTLLIGSVFSIGMSIFKSVNMEKIRFMGTTAQAALGHPTSSQLRQLGELDYIEIVGTNNHVANITNAPQMGTLSLALHYFDKTEWEKMRIPAYENVYGNYPVAENEIMVSRAVLEQWGINDPAIGMEIPLLYYIDDKMPDDLCHETFRLSGWFTNHTLAYSMYKADVILVSEALSQKHGKNASEDGSASLIFDNESRVTEYLERLKEDLQISEEQPIVSAQIYSDDNDTLPTMMLAFGAIIAFIVLTGYLLIYNVLYISVSRDVRFYGLLKTLGTTPRQIKCIVVGQIFSLSMIGIPIGIILTVLLSMIVIPAAISALDIVSTGAVISFSPLIYLGAGIFALLTAFLGAFKPAKKAASISPIEAQKFTGVNYNQKHVYRQIRGKTHKMAIRNIFRDKKRAVVALLGLLLGITTFTVITTLVSSMDMNNYLDSMYKNDFVLQNDTVHPWYQQTQKFDADFIEQLENLSGLEYLEYTIREAVFLDYSPEEFGDYATNLLERDNHDASAFSEEEIKKDFHGYMVGVSSDFLRELKSGLGNIDYDAFERGEFALIATDNPSLLSNVPELKITPMQWTEGGPQKVSGSKEINIPVGGFAPYSLYAGGGIAPTIIVSQSFMQKHYSNPTIFEIRLDITQEFREQSLEIIKQAIGGDSEIALMAKIEASAELKGIITTLFVLGGGIALVIALIGILNFVNIMSVGVMARKQELATLESIGMSKKQMRSMLRYEGIGYAGVTIIGSLTLGNLISFGIFKLFQQQASYAVFTYPFIPAVTAIVAILVVCLITPEIAYRGMSKMTLADRLREAE